jgi:hypothetical protein
LVAGKSTPEPSNTRLQLGDHIADILVDNRQIPSIYHWIVQKIGSPAIVQWGQEYTFDEAKSAAEAGLGGLNENRRPKA